MKLFLAACVACLPGLAFSSTFEFDVSAFDHSYSGGAGSGLNTSLFFEVGDTFQISADTNDTWVLGSGDRTGNADGLPAFPNYDSDGLSALFGTLVGRIGTGSFFSIGTSFNGIAPDSGVLSLFAWDENNSDNRDEIAVTITTVEEGIHPVVPVPASLPLMLGALGLAGLARRRYS